MDFYFLLKIFEKILVISKNLIGKYIPGTLAMCQKPLDHSKKNATKALKSFSQRIIQKAAEAISDLIDNEIAKKITKVSKSSQQNNSGTVTDEHDKRNT